jgi:hypothetical protein
MKKNLLLGLFTVLSCLMLQAQVVITDPIFANQGSTITVTFDASKGNQALKGFTGPVYAHTGLITNTSTTGSDWKNVQGTWGTADARVLMTSIGNDKHTLTYNIGTYYGITAGTTVLRLAFVFRNANGSTVGRDTDGSDIFYDIYPNDNLLRAKFFEPSTATVLLQTGSSIPLFAAANQSSAISITDNGLPVASQTGATSITANLVGGGVGNHEVILTAVAGNNTARDTFKYTVPGQVVTQDPPAGTLLGATEMSNSQIRLMLHAPGKSSVYVLGDFNNWTLGPNYLMKRSVDGKNWWIDITGLTPGQVYGYQYQVDGSILIADPLSTVILDPSNDAFISNSVFPNMPPYPNGKTTGHVSLLYPGKAPYAWQSSNVTPPAKTDMIVYELMMRDYLDDHAYYSLLDTLSYLKRLGVNVIELMPVSEFENNNSWGYNVSYHMALDKYYGSPERFKAFVDAAHQRNISVVLDVVYNHAFGQSPLARLYWDGSNNRPAANNPWLNPEARHPFNVGSDFNHESQATKDYVNRTLKYWLTEYKIDGFRFDLSKGFTQTLNTDVSAWGQLDQSRINILKGYADAVWATKSDALVILEHFADNAEETILANYGMMLWGNSVFNYNEASMGYPSNAMGGVSHLSRNWSVPHLIGYMESHDEERLMYKNLNFGNSSGSYSVKDLNTALLRQELVNAFFLTVPGPKMIWQHGELGYDFSINTCTNGNVDPNCRLDPKPIRWGYQSEGRRKKLFEVVRSLIHLRNTQSVFKTGIYSISELGPAPAKAFHLSSTGLNVTILGNFDVVSQSINPVFQHTGKWYDYIKRDSITITNASSPILLAPGEYHVYTDQLIALPVGSELLTSSSEPNAAVISATVYPNPSHDIAYLQFSLRQISNLRITPFDVNGRIVGQSVEDQFAEGENTFAVPVAGLAPGVYLIKIESTEGTSMVKFIKGN